MNFVFNTYLIYLPFPGEPPAVTPARLHVGPLAPGEGEGGFTQEEGGQGGGTGHQCRAGGGQAPASLPAPTRVQTKAF